MAFFDRLIWNDFVKLLLKKTFDNYIIKYLVESPNHRSLETRINLSADLNNISQQKVDILNRLICFFSIPNQCFLSREILYNKFIRVSSDLWPNKPKHQTLKHFFRFDLNNPITQYFIQLYDLHIISKKILKQNYIYLIIFIIKMRWNFITLTSNVNNKL